MSNIQHPLEKGTKVKYLEPRCKCMNPPWTVKTGTIHIITERSGGEYTYGITGTKHRIPSKAVFEII